MVLSHQVPFTSLVLVFNDSPPQYVCLFFLDYRKVFLSANPDGAVLRNIVLPDSCLFVSMFIPAACSKHELTISNGSLTPAHSSYTGIFPISSVSSRVTSDGPFKLSRSAVGRKTHF